MRGPVFGLSFGLLASALLAGCGRISFDPGDGTGGGDGGARGDGGGDAGPPAETEVLDVTGPGTEQINDLAFGPGGELAMIGGYGGSVQLGGVGLTSAAGGGDLMLALIGTDRSARWGYTLGATTMALGQNVVWEGATVIGGGYFAGTTQLGALSSGGGQDVVLVRATAAGDAVTAAGWGGSQNVQLRALSSDGTSTAIGGVYGGSPNFGAGPIATALADNGFVAVGGPATFPTTRALLGGSDIYVNDLEFDADGALCVTGRFNATTDFGAGAVGSAGSSTFVAKYEAGLALRWVRAFGTGLNATGVTTTADGDCVAIGMYQGTITVDAETVTAVGGEDVYIGRFDAASGAAHWLRSLGGATADLGFGVVVLPSQQVVVAGSLTGASSLGGLTLTSEGASDGYVAVLTGAGVPQALLRVGGTGAITNTTGGITHDPARGVVAAGFQYTGELVVDGLTRTAAGTDAAIVILPIAP